MKSSRYLYFLLRAAFFLSTVASSGHALAAWQISYEDEPLDQQQDASPKERRAYQPSEKPNNPARDSYGNAWQRRKSTSPFLLKDPKGVEQEVVVDRHRNYVIYERMNGRDYRYPSTVDFSEIKHYLTRDFVKQRWKEQSIALDGESPVTGRNLIPNIYVAPWFSEIFGSDFIEFHPNILFSLDLSSRWQTLHNPAIPIRQRRTWTPNMEPQMNLNVTGNVGDKLQVVFNYDTQTPFATSTGGIKNSFKIEYTGYEEEIIKKIEVGNVAMPSGNSLMSGSQSLFGIKTQLQFGKFYLTSVLSNQRGSPDRISINGDNGQTSQFDILGSAYDENKHFFLGHFFRKNYEEWLSNLPQVVSGVNVTRVEAYVLNRNNATTQLRNILAFTDLGEGMVLQRANQPNIQPINANSPAGNDANGLFQYASNTNGMRGVANAEAILRGSGLERSIDYQLSTSARKLEDTEFTLQRNLGYISLNRALQNSEILAVAYEYTYRGERYKVGELAEDYQNLQGGEMIFVKLLRPEQVNTALTTWDLMMKNIYEIGAYQVERRGFTMRVHYQDVARGFNNPALNEGANTRDKPLVGLLGLDTLNSNNDAIKDGNFDFIAGITIHADKGRIVFPVLEPFGSTMASYFNEESEASLLEKYVFHELYDMTKADAARLYEKDRFHLVGEYQAQGSGGEFRLPAFGVVPDSVVVTSGGTRLTEGTDYTINYAVGTVTILNQGILNSGKDIDIAYEKANLVSNRNRTLIGTRLEYDYSDNITFGSNIFSITDRRGGITRYPVGSEPVRNVMYGFDANYKAESLWLTRALDVLPLFSTKEVSEINLAAEYAQLLPGTTNEINGVPTFYIEDFERNSTFIDLTSPNAWSLASTPVVPDGRFNLATGGDPLAYGHRRALLSWYTIDNAFYGNNSPQGNVGNLGISGLDNQYVRMIPPQELFPNRTVSVGVQGETTLNLNYFPAERGPYNYNPNVDARGLLGTPNTNWAGVVRAINTEVDFEKANIRYLEFWLMDPFTEGADGIVHDGIFNQNNTTGGRIVFNLGDVSEDVIPDALHSFENGLPPDGSNQGVVTTRLGRVPATQQINRSFTSNNAASRREQDVGFDGLSNEAERTFFSTNFLNRLPTGVRAVVQNDPSSDNFRHYASGVYNTTKAGIVQRYKHYNGTDGNSPVLSGNNISASSTTIPENEDLNRDNTVNQVENYYEYNIPLSPSSLSVGSGYVVDAINTGNASWYLFRVPIADYERIQGNINNFKSIRFVRMYLTGFSQPVALRFTKMRLVGTEWIEYEESLYEGAGAPPPREDTVLTVSALSVEENAYSPAGKSPYVTPPGIDRDQDDFSLNGQVYNERSLQLCVDDLADGDGRAVFKPINTSLVNYENFTMFFHAEGDQLSDGDIMGFVRMGADFSQNYYEIAIPLHSTPTTLAGGSLSRQIWPRENEIDISLNEVLAVKIRRDRENAPTTTPYTQVMGRHIVSVVGNPRVSGITSLMIGVRNPNSPDGRAKDACIWANEMRMTGIDKKNGWATKLQANMKWADFSDISFNARYSTPGFGDVQAPVQQRSQQEDIRYDVSSSLNLDKIIPGRTGIKVPAFVSYEAFRSRPEYDPLDGDIPLEATLLSRDQDERVAYENLVTEQSSARSLNFSNVRKERTKEDATPHIYDVENFSLSYNYNDSHFASVNTAHRIEKNEGGSLAYNYRKTGDFIKPFEKIDFLQSPYFALVKDFSFNLFPNALGWNMSLQRNFMETQLRNSDLTTVGVVPVYEKIFLFNRNYSLGWNLSESLALNVNADLKAVVDEPPGRINTDEKNEVVWNNLQTLGRTAQYDHNMDITYKIPIQKFPLTSWISMDTQYNASYRWQSGSLTQRETLGNEIKNSRRVGINTRFGLKQLFGRLAIVDKITKTPAASAGDGEGKDGGVTPFMRVLFLPITMWNAADVVYSLSNSTLLPGFLPTHYALGLDENFMAPGYAFVLGDQSASIRQIAAQNDWLVKSEELSATFMQDEVEDITVRTSIEPLKALSIQLTASRKTQRNYEENFRYDTTQHAHRSFSPSRSGSYNASFISIATAFQTVDTQSQAFDDFQRYRAIIKERIEQNNPYGVSYQQNAQDVLGPAFLAAYSGQNPQSISTNTFHRIPLPNWRLSYAGLSEVLGIKEIFPTISLNHAYTANYTTGNFSNSLLYANDLTLDNPFFDYHYAFIVNQGNLVPYNLLNQISITENFGPLVGLNIALWNKMTFRFNWRKGRNISLNFSNNQLTETHTDGLSFGYSYTRDNLKIPLNIRGEQFVLKNQITLQLTLGSTESITYQRVLDGVGVLTGGNIRYQGTVSVDYNLSQAVNVRCYVDSNVNEPYVSTSYKIENTSVGVQFRVNFSE